MNVVKRVSHNSFYLIASRIIGIVFTMILGIYIARKLGDAGYGQYSFIVTFIAYFMFSSAHEPQSLIVREVAQNKQQTNEFLSAALVFKLLVSIVAIILVLLITCLIKKISLLTPILIAILALIPISIYDSFDAVLRAHERMGFIALTNIIYSFLKMLVGIKILSVTSNPTMLFTGFFFIELARAVLIGIFYHFNIRHFEWIFQLFRLKYLYDESFVLAIKVTIGVIYYKIDIFLLSLLTNDAEVGWYAAAVNIVGLVTMVLMIGTGVLIPTMSQFFINSKSHLYKLYQLINKYIYIILVPFTLIVMSLASPMVKIIYGYQYEPACKILTVSILSIIPSAILGLQGMIILISGEYKRMMRLYLIIDSFKVVLSFFLIRLYGLIGAAVALVAVETMAAIIYQPYAQRHLERMDILSIVRKPLFCIVILSFLALFISYNFKISLNIMLIPAVLLYLVYIFRTHVVTFEEIGYIKKIFR